ncbi:MAG: tetratricopeptide repeat protein [Gammaproteobacteria bacterium]|nr:tetratricopeptide repeat protein [Gammaproteobacteria bacterium]
MQDTPFKPCHPIALLLLTLALWLPLQAVAEELDALQEGQQAFNRGDYIASFSLWSTLATQGHADAQVFVGLSYENGWGTPKSVSLAEVWYQKAARNNNVTGQYLLGLRLLSGTGLDRARGLMWLQQAAANGDGSARQFLDKGESRGWFTGLIPDDTPANEAAMLASPPTLPPVSMAKPADSQSIALID